MTQINDKPKVTIVGAGLGGALMAAQLGQAGYAVDVYEYRSDPRGSGIPAGRSINLAVSNRGLHAIEQIGLKDEILKIAVPMKGRMIHSVSGELTYQPYGTEANQAINSVSRGLLNLKLIEAAAGHSNVAFHFDHKCIGMDLKEGRLEFLHPPSGETRNVNGAFTIGADGAFSAIRSAMQRLDRFDFSQDYLEHGYKELTIPPGGGGEHRLEKNALHIWPRRSFMMIALPNFDGSFTCTLFFPFEGPKSFAALRTDDHVKRFFEIEFPDAVPLMPTLIDDFNTNPTGSLMTVRCGPWRHEDKVVLLGDACHAVVPFYGQGANAAFEDCTVLSECLANSSRSLEENLAHYYELRKFHVDTLADLAIENFIEMRDHTGSRLFMMKKKFEKLLHRLFPRWFLPLYSMVTFSRVPYADAVARARKQWSMVRGVTTGVIFILIVALVKWIK